MTSMLCVWACFNIAICIASHASQENAQITGRTENPMVVLPTVCQVVYSFNRLHQPNEDDLALELYNFIKENSDLELVHSPYIIDNQLYVKGNCQFLQDFVLTKFSPTPDLRAEYWNWPFDPE